MISDERVLSVPLAEWDKLKSQAEIVLQENQILADQKVVYKKIIDELNQELHNKTYNQSKEILWLMQDKNTLEEEVLLANQEKERLKQKVEEQKEAMQNLENKCKEKLQEAGKVYSNLQEKYRQLQMESEKKVDVTVHKQHIDKLNKTKTNEIKLLVNENNSLKLKLNSLTNEKELLEIKLVKNAGTSFKMRAQFLEKEMKRLKVQLSGSLRRAEEACCQELMYRKTLSKLVKISEMRLIDRKTLASVIRNEKAKYGQLKESLGYSSVGKSLDSDQPIGYDFEDFGENTMNYGDNTNVDSDGLCGDVDYGESCDFKNGQIPGLDEGDNTQINVDYEDPVNLYSYDLGDKESGTVKYEGDKGEDESAFLCATETGTLGELMEGNTVREICRKYNIPMSDVSIV